jgi:molybdate transport system ATP-binding protein
VLDVDVEVDRRDFTVRAELSVAPGERLALFGPSGAGKTTLLEAIAGLVRPRRARITLGGRVLTATGPPRQAVPPWRRRVGLLRQDPALFPHLSVRANLTYGPGAGSSAADLAGLAGVLGIGELLPVMPAALSGGQAHRVALGRLLLARCDALLLDEPYTGLDARLRRTLTDLVWRLVAERAVPGVLVAHELADAQAFADRLAVLDSGVVLQVGAPDEVVLRPASRRVAELVGYLGFVPAGPWALPGRAALAGVHPERVVAGSHPGRGLVLTGRLASRPAPGGELVVTVLDPPCFGEDGTALPPPPSAGAGRAGSENAAAARAPAGPQPGGRAQAEQERPGHEPAGQSPLVPGRPGSGPPTATGQAGP